MGKVKEMYFDSMTEDELEAIEEHDAVMEAATEYNQRQHVLDKQMSFAVNFVRFNENNPKIFHKIVQLADRQRERRDHYSIEIIMNVVRYHTDLDGKGDPFKINNNYKAYYARMYMQYRECPGFFSIRGSLADEYDFVPDIGYYEDWLNEQETNK